MGAGKGVVWTVLYLVDARLGGEIKVRYLYSVSNPIHALVPVKDGRTVRRGPSTSTRSQSVTLGIWHQRGSARIRR